MSQQEEKIQLFITGGTFDKDYNFLTGELSFKDSRVSQMLERGRCTVDHDIKTLMMVHSLEMTEEDRQIIVHNCKKTVHNRIIITHGTDRMVETAKNLAAAQIEKTIVLTGAMIPYAFGNSSDGFFNLGAALAFVQTLPNGVYVVMNGRFFVWNNVRKNLQTGSFESLEH